MGELPLQHFLRQRVHRIHHFEAIISIQFLLHKRERSYSEEGVEHIGLIARAVGNPSILSILAL